MPDYGFSRLPVGDPSGNVLALQPDLVNLLDRMHPMKIHSARISQEPHRLTFSWLFHPSWLVFGEAAIMRATENDVASPGLDNPQLELD